MMRYIVLISLLLISSVAAAQEDPMAIVREGIALQNRGNDAGALERFQHAWELGHRPIALGQMGLAEQRLSHWIEAESHLRQVLAIHGDEWVERMRARIDSAYAVVQQRVGTLEVNGNPAGAHVLINGVEVGVLPFAEPLHVEAGTVALEVRADGHYPVNRSVVIVAGQPALETVELREQPVGETLSGATGTATTNARPWLPGAVLGGSGAVVLLVGGILVGVGWSMSTPTPPGCLINNSGPWTCTTTDSVGHINAGANEVITGYVMGGIGIAAGATGLIWGVLSNSGSHRRAWRVVPGLASAQFEWRF